MDKIITYYKGEKYDITNFVSLHPGGNVIKEANGVDVEKIWNEKAPWHNNRFVLNILKLYKVKDNNYMETNKVIFLIFLFIILIIIYFFKK